jgi:hypothetical protein
MRRNFRSDVLAMCAVTISLAVLAVGVKTNTPLFSGIAVLIALTALILKFILSKDRRKSIPPSSDSPRRRITDQHDEVSVAH